MHAFARSFPGRVWLAMLPLLAASCDGETPEPEGNVSANGSASVLPVAVPEPSVLDREALLIAALRAASAAASGQDDAEAQASLDGARFEIAIRFGCAAPPAPPPPPPPASADERAPAIAVGPREPAETAADPRPEPAGTARTPEAMGWTYDPKQERLRIQAAPGISRDDPVVMALAGGAIEAAEGFWIPRPWQLSASCPSAPAAALAAPAPLPLSSAQPPTLGIVQFFTASDSRTERRAHRPYEKVQSLPAAEVERLRSGFDLVLSGRLKAFKGRAISCAVRSPGLAPTCLISAEFGTVRLVRPDTKAVLAQWGQG